MDVPLTGSERQVLLTLARQTIEAAVDGRRLPEIPNGMLTPSLSEQGASFVTLTKRGKLRGCIGALEAYQPLAVDVREHAAAAALEDYRFPNVTREELPEIDIEISRLTAPVPIEYRDADDLLGILRPGIDGIILRDGLRRATFLPQVWKQIPDKAEFLAHLCQKMGASPDAWKKKHLEVLIYQVEEFQET